MTVVLLVVNSATIFFWIFLFLEWGVGGLVVGGFGCFQSIYTVAMILVGPELSTKIPVAQVNGQCEAVIASVARKLTELETDQSLETKGNCCLTI